MLGLFQGDPTHRAGVSTDSHAVVSENWIFQTPACYQKTMYPLPGYPTSIQVNS